MKNKISIYLLAFVLISGSAFAQSKETRTVDTFTKISFGVSGKLYLTQGSPQKVEIEGSKEALSRVQTEVSGGRLKIKTEKSWTNWHDEGQIKVYVTVKDIEAVDVSGSGDLVAQTVLTGKDFSFNVSGSGSLEAEVQASGDISTDVSGSGGANLKGKCNNFESSISGSGDVEINAIMNGNASFELSGSGKIVATGRANTVKASTSGSGEVRGANFQVDSCEIDISGSGDVEINVKSSLDATISGSGSVSYKGDPAHVNSHASGSGHVRKM
jgi:Putative auto-transporter adhesin, head GIN domain